MLDPEEDDAPPHFDISLEDHEEKEDHDEESKVEENEDGTQDSLLNPEESLLVTDRMRHHAQLGADIDPSFVPTEVGTLKIQWTTM